MIIGLRPPLPLLFYAKGVGFIRKGRVGYNLIQPRLYLYLPILQDLSIYYLLNHLGSGPPSSGLQAKWADSWWAPLFLLSKSSRHGAHGTKPHHIRINVVFTITSWS
jgi:hypothetical protein